MTKTVWITGASSGIGEALARAYADRGADLVLSARRADALAAVRLSLPEPERALVLPLDVADAASFEDAIAAATAWRGSVDVLINSAGITQRGAAVDTDASTVRRIMEVNFFGAVELSRLLAPTMVGRGSGHLVFVSSVVGYVATPMRSAYAASKHAIRAWADAVRAELHGTGVDVTVVVPGYIATGMSAKALTADGSLQGTRERTDEKGLDVAVAAQRILRGLDRRKAEILVGGLEVKSILVKRFTPSVVTRFLHRFAPGDD